MNKKQTETKFKQIKADIEQAKQSNSAPKVLATVDSLNIIGERALQRFKLASPDGFQALKSELVDTALSFIIEQVDYKAFMQSFDCYSKELNDSERYLQLLNQYIFSAIKISLDEWKQEGNDSLTELNAKINDASRGTSYQNLIRLDTYRQFIDLRDNGFQTVVTVQLSSHILCKAFSFEFAGHSYSFEFSYADNKNANVSSNEILMQGDIHGVTKQTMITITTDKFIQHQGEVIGLLNYFVKAYRIAMNEAWLLKVSEKNILETNIYYKLDGHQIERKILPPQGTFSIPNEEDYSTEKLLEELNNPSRSLWLHSYLDAKLNFGINNFTQSVMYLNIAFENFVTLKADERLSRNLTQDELELFYSGRSYVNLDDKYKEFITEDDFTSKILSDSDYVNRPTTFKIVKYCNKVEKFSLGMKKINSQINRIRKYRNDIAHGRYIDDTCLMDHIPQAFESFDSFIALWE
ncbi:hypothetical protein F0231_20165 [Vibrio sp. RE86]|uniref:hypothetical protein n=1 Tax=Vibrio sp. RE86 TaxID=2607605 RepID=UPI001493A18B|nr:hypothetical protein [Vibrio sp. RE86]NOH82041.1 hypothetical protein [Vibrio sp. RE86]